MATLAIGAGLGTALAASSGAAIAGGVATAGLIAGGVAVAGAAAYAIPRLQQDPPDQEGARLDDARLMTRSASEGATINRCFGPENRMAGNILWISNLEEQKRVDEIEVGKDQTQDVTSYKYFISLAVGLCADDVEDVRKVWANGKVIYESFIAADVTSDLIDAERIDILGIFGIALKLISPPGGPDLSVFLPGAITIVTGFPFGAEFLNNSIGSICILSGSELDGTTWTIVANPLAADYTNPGGVDIHIVQLNLFFLPFRALAMDIYKGLPLQGVHPSMLLYPYLSFPAELHPAYRHLSMFVITRLWLEEFGNNIPTFSFLVKKDVTKPASEAIAYLLEQAGLTSDDYDVSRATGTIQGYTIANIESPLQSMRPILRAFDIITQETDGKLVFFNRGDEDTYNVDESDLSSAESGSEAIRGAQVSDTAGWGLPSMVSVGYYDPQVDYQRASQNERLVNAPTGYNNMIVDLPLTMTATAARFIARRELWRAWTNRQTIACTLPPRYARIQEGDALIVTSRGITYRVILTKVDRGANFLMNVEGLVEDAIVLPAGEQDDAEESGSTTFFPPYLLLAMLDLPPLTTARTDVHGVYYAIAAIDPAAFWPGAKLFRSTSGGADTFVQVQTFPIESTFGMADDVLADGPVGYWDNVNTVTVTLKEGTLSSRTEFEVLNGSNMAYIGGEIIAFTTATLVGTRQYELSGLLRGLRNTEQYTGSHASGEIFVPLFSSNLGFLEIDTGVIGTTRYYKAVASNGEESDASAVTHTHESNTTKPFAPCNLVGTRDGSNNLELNWVRRTRDIIRFFAFSDPEDLDGPEEYEIDFWDTGVVVRTETVTDTTYTYSAANQTSDGITPGDPIQIDIYKISSTGRRGHRLRETI